MLSSGTITEQHSQPPPDARDGPEKLIPHRLPQAGEQYGFEVDLDACSGCGSCVAACHQENGLAPGERWRHIGSLVGGTGTVLPMLQHITTACHHCLEPACLQGCPAEAYEKDPVTGIVAHIDDHCIGCQYCTLTCPYDIPVYNAARGTVGKCDMCHARLAGGAAPACVRACPHEAIRIRIVDTLEVRASAHLQATLPGAPEATHTVPATTFVTGRTWPSNTVSSDFFSVRRTEGHGALVVMLVLTQMAAGGFAAEFLLHARIASTCSAVRPVHLVATLLLGLIGMSAATFHLGRPERAYRAVLGWRRSWLSREIIAFALFASTAALYASASLLLPEPTRGVARIERVLGAIATVAGMAAVFTSIMIYAATPRPLWRFARTAPDFALTMVVLALPLMLLTSVAGAAVADLPVADVTGGWGRHIAALLIGSTILKLGLEGLLFRHLRSPWPTPQRRAAMLHCGELSMLVVWRHVLAILGGVFLPGILLAQGMVSRSGYDALFVGVSALLGLVLLTIGELISRYLFFATSVGPRMPGVLS